MILRTLIVGAIAGCCFIPYFVAGSAEFPVKMGVAIFLTNVLIGLLAIPLIDWIIEKLGLVKTSCEVVNIEVKV